jgi:hypothetical protein
VCFKRKTDKQKGKLKQNIKEKQTTSKRKQKIFTKGVSENIMQKIPWETKRK